VKRGGGGEKALNIEEFAITGKPMPFVVGAW